MYLHKNIRTWGSVANKCNRYGRSFSIYEAYGELNFNKKLSAKVGRQAISYDDDRIFQIIRLGNARKKT